MSTRTPPSWAPATRPSAPSHIAATACSVGQHRDRDVGSSSRLGSGPGDARAELIGQGRGAFRGAVVKDDFGTAAREGARHRGAHAPGSDDRDLHRVASSVERIVAAMRSAEGIWASSSTGFAASGMWGVVMRTTGPSRS